MAIENVNSIIENSRAHRADNERRERFAQHFSDYLGNLFTQFGDICLTKNVDVSRGSRGTDLRTVHAFSPVPTDHGFLSVVEQFRRNSDGTVRSRLDIVDYPEDPNDIWNDGTAIAGRSDYGELWGLGAPLTAQSIRTLVALTNTVIHGQNEPLVGYEIPAFVEELPSSSREQLTA